MATKVHSPTTNIYAALLLAEAHAVDYRDDRPSSSKPKASANAQQTAELTPKERAAAKAEENAAKVAKRQAERERKALEAEQKKAFEALPDEGFSKQRPQRIKEYQTAKRAADSFTAEPKSTENEKKNKGPNNKQGQTKHWKNPLKDDASAPVEGEVKGKAAKDPQASKPKGTNGKPPKRDFDKHSAGKTGRQAVAKKDGSGKRNWGNDVPAAAQTTQTSAALSAVAGDDWDSPGYVAPAAESQSQTKVEGDDEWNAEGFVAPDPSTTTDETAAKEEDEEKSEDKELSLEEYYALRAAEKAALAALLGGTRDKPRELTADETKSLSQFTLVENIKEKDPKETKLASTSSSSKPAANASARKGEKAVAIDAVLNVRVAPPPREREGRGRGRGRGGVRGGVRGERGERGENPAPAPASGENTEKPKQKPNKEHVARGGGNTSNRGGQGRRVKINQHSQEQFPSLGKV